VVKGKKACTVLPRGRRIQKGVVRCSRTKIEIRKGFFKVPPMKRVIGIE